MTVFEMIEAQQKGKEDTTVFMVGGQLKDICRADPACAEIVAADLQQEAMSIANCEKKIKENIRFEKGIKSIKTNLNDKTVTIEYDADKTTIPAIIEGFKKIKYEAKEVKTNKTKQDK